MEGRLAFEFLLKIFFLNKLLNHTNQSNQTGRCLVVVQRVAQWSSKRLYSGRPKDWKVSCGRPKGCTVVVEKVAQWIVQKAKSCLVVIQKVATGQDRRHGSTIVVKKV